MEKYLLILVLFGCTASHTMPADAGADVDAVECDPYNPEHPELCSWDHEEPDPCTYLMRECE